MDKTKNKKIQKIVAWISMIAIILLFTVMPLLSKQEQTSNEPKASILSGTVEVGSVNSKVVGGGTLAEEEAESISVLSSVKLKNYFVSNGDMVSKGTPIASVDRVTVMSAIAEVQETLNYLAEKIEAESEEKTDSNVTALVGGKVKILYAEKGMSVQDIMLEHGALAVLSLDGLMGADITTESDLTAGSTVKVTLSNGTTVEGKVETNLVGKMTVTIKDNDYAVGEKIQVTKEDGTLIGSSELYIFSPWNATAYTGTVDSIKVSKGDNVDAGETLMKLTNTGYTATYSQLVNQRQAYEELMMELFTMYQTQTLTAPCDGIVMGIDKDSTQLLAGNGQNESFTLISKSPSGNNEILYSSYIGMVTAIEQNSWILNINPQRMELADYKNLPQISLDTSAMTDIVVYQPNQTQEISVPIYEQQNGEWVQIEMANIVKGDILLFAEDSIGNAVWIVRVQQSQTDPNMSNQPSTPSNSNIPSMPSNPSTTYPSMGESNGISGPWNGMENMQGGMMEQGVTDPQAEDELYGMDVVEIATVTPQNTIILDITMNELDVTSLKIGMSAEIRIDALGSEKFNAIITDISNTGTNNGGYSFFTVELTMERNENMLAGMNATATMLTATVNEVLTIPAEALVEEGTKTIIYTGYDEKNDILIDPLTVTIGASDGQTVEIIEGLEAGTTYYYAYYDTMELSFTPDFGGR